GKGDTLRKRGDHACELLDVERIPPDPFHHRSRRLDGERRPNKQRVEQLRGVVIRQRAQEKRFPVWSCFEQLWTCGADDEQRTARPPIEMFDEIEQTFAAPVNILENED